MSDESWNEPPKPTAGDRLHSLARAGLGSVPIIGNAAVELFSAIVMPPLERRRDAWRSSIAERLMRLEQEGLIKIEELRDNDVFISIVMQATTAAMRSHEADKLNALRNAVVNSAISSEPDDTLQQMFINLVDALTVWHIRLLKLLQDPVKWFRDAGREPPQFVMSSSTSRVIETAFPELKGRRDFYDLLGKELLDKGLLGTSGFHTMMTATGALQRMTTSFGDKFLAYIVEPIVK